MADLAHPELAVFRRRVFTALSLISMVLCLAVLIFWWQSYYFYDLLLYRQIDTRTLHLLWVESDGGSLNFFTNQFPIDQNSKAESGWQYDRNSRTWNSLVGKVVEYPVGLGSQLGLGIIYPRGVVIPHWLFALAFAILPATYVISALRTRRRHRIGLCSACGYDLRASPGRCPECGAIGGRPEDSVRVV